MPKLSDQGRAALLIAGLALAVLLSGCAHGTPSAMLRGSPFLSALDLPAVGGTPYAPRALRRQVVLVNFFATWCFPCLGELPLLQKLHEKHAAQGFTVVAVGMDVEGPRVLDPFARLYAFPFPVVVADAALREGQSPFGRIAALPTSFLLDRSGAVVAAYQGLADAKDLEHYLEKALAEPP